jgi:DNA invertase Pin-like site-specific DNA recombinase
MFSVQDKLAGLRGVSLLRASTTKQTTGGDEKDIPAQREIVNEFMERNGIIKVKEFVEGGISAFKIKADDRDALNRIKAMADRKEFDILVVYYSDRIGRISEETPLVISYLNKRGILVYSVREGKISTESQLDKLMTYLTFWNNENESIKIRNRSTDYHILLIQNGKYRGGGERTLAYGYRLVNKGTKNAKGRNILDVEIDPETSKIVKLIYDLSVNYNIGSRAIASYLNENGYKDKLKGVLEIQKTAYGSSLINFIRSANEPRSSVSIGRLRVFSRQSSTKNVFIPNFLATKSSSTSFPTIRHFSGQTSSISRISW